MVRRYLPTAWREGNGRPDSAAQTHGQSITFIRANFHSVVSARPRTRLRTQTHFTQSAGLIAVHPVADALVDEFPFFAWLLRAKSYIRFGYDPDAAFTLRVNDFGFEINRSCRIVAAA